MNWLKALVITAVPTLMAASCNSDPLLPDPDAGFSWKTLNSASGLHDQARQGFVGPPTWANDGNLVSGAEQYYQRKDVCSGFPVCNGYETKDYRYRIFTQELGSGDNVYLNVVTPGIIANLFHLESQGYWLVTHQTEGPDSELVFNRITRSSDQPTELGRDSLEFVDRHDSWWVPSPNGESIGRVVCNRMPDFAGGSAAFPDIFDDYTQVNVAYGQCALSFLDPLTGGLLWEPVLVEFPWATSGWDMNNEPYDFTRLPRYGFVYWTANGALAVSDYENAAYAVYPGDAAATAINLRTCQGPLTQSAAINDQGQVLSIVDGTIAVVSQNSNATFQQCNQ